MKTQKTLERLVALRRQKAEQAMALITAEIRREEAALAGVEAQVKALDAAAEDYASHSLAMRHGHPGHLQKQIEAHHRTLGAKRAQLEDARLALKKAIHSEERLQDLARGQ